MNKKRLINKLENNNNWKNTKKEHQQLKNRKN